MRLRPVLTVLLLVALACGLLGPAFGPARADNLQDRKQAADRAVERLKDSLADTKADLAQAVVASHAADQRLSAARGREDAAESALAAAQQRDRALAARLSLAKDDEAKAEDRVADISSELAAGQRTVNSIARRAYQSGHTSTLSVFLDSRSPSDFTDKIQMVQGALRSEGTAVRQLNAMRADLRTRQAAVQQKRELIADLKDQAAKNVVARTSAEAAASAARHDAQTAAAQADAAEQAMQSQKAEEESRLREQQAASDHFSALIKARIAAAKEAARKERIRRADAAAQAAAAAKAAGEAAPPAPSDPGDGGGTTVIGGGVLSRPGSGPITSPYGMRLHPVLHVWKLHDGTDFGEACGTPIHAAMAGTVIWAQNFNGYGNQLAIDHGVVNGVSLTTSYSHQERFAVGVGTHVERGQVIGYTGQTGYATGCHIHFMVYVNGNVVNPMSWL